MIQSKVVIQEAARVGLTAPLNRGQNEAIRQMVEWIKTSHCPYYHLGGYAGTGKTTVTRRLLNEYLNYGYEDVALCAFTAKAANVLGAKANRPASTIHSLIYTHKPSKELEEAKARLKHLRETNAAAQEIHKIKAVIHSLQEKNKGFHLKSKEALDGLRLIIADECSMVGAKMLQDLLSFNIKVLFLGDEGQLPPISRDEKSLHQLIPINYHLTEVMRQSGNDIPEFAELARKGSFIPLRPLQNGFGKLAKDEITPELLAAAGAVICATNRKRRELNKTVRTHLDLTTRYPKAGEKVTCRFNSKDLGVFRGEVYDVMSDAKLNGDWLELELLAPTDEDPGNTILIKADPVGFDAYHNKDLASDFDKSRIAVSPKHPPFDFGYAFTVHSAQGSEWDNVVVIDDYWKKAEPEYQKWLYTAITRAKESVLIGA